MVSLELLKLYIQDLRKTQMALGNPKNQKWHVSSNVINSNYENHTNVIWPRKKYSN